MNAVPFSVDRESPVPLVKQVADGCRDAIATGAFPVGTLLPSLHTLEERLGVSFKVVRSAYERLAKEGWLVPQHGVGYLAKNPGVPIWKGAALLIYNNNSYNMCTSANALQRRLEIGGYLVDCVKIAKCRERRVNELDRLRARLFKRYDVAFTYTASRDVVRMLATLDCPIFTLATEGACEPPLRTIAVDESKAYGDLVRACRARNVRTIEIVDINVGELPAERILHDAGFRVSSFRTPFDYREDNFFSSIRRRARDMFQRRFAHDRKNLPDLFLFLDDYVATGALPVFLANGIRIPEDVRVVVQVSRGNEPCWIRDLTTLAIDATRHGTAVAERVLDALGGLRRLPAVKGVVEFVPGKTL